MRLRNWYILHEPTVLFRGRLALRNAWFRWVRYRHFKTAACDVCGDYVLEAQLVRTSAGQRTCTECLVLMRTVRKALRNGSHSKERT